MPEALPMTPRPRAAQLPAHVRCRCCLRWRGDVALWVDRDLCHECHGPKRPTHRQEAELGRIEDRHGQVAVRQGNDPGSLLVTLGQKRRTMDERGRLR